MICGKITPDIGLTELPDSDHIEAVDSLDQLDSFDLKGAITICRGRGIQGAQ